MLHKVPFLLTLLGMAGGVLIAILFGANEEMFKARIEAGLQRNAKLQQIADPEQKAAKLASEADKSWRYYQRYHFHATGIGAMAIGLLLFLRRVNGAPESVGAAASWLVAIGGFLYPFVWLFAGMYGPEMGRSEAKEAFAVFGYSGGLFLVGILISIYLAVRYDLSRTE